jgi:probable DNA metabolism protein
MTAVRFDGTFEDWQANARNLLRQQIPPREVEWIEERGQQTLVVADWPETTAAVVKTTVPVETSASAEFAFRVPKRFVELARNVAAFRDTKKWRLLYSVLFRIANENHHLLKVETDDEVIQLLRMEDAVSRDVHHVHAFVRFKKIIDLQGERYVAWYKPDHISIRLAAPFFAARFGSMRWSILTPDESAHWDGKKLTFSPGVVVAPDNGEDDLEALWCKYYATTFNPARANLDKMRSEMPQRFWSHMPEMANLPKIMQSAPERVEEMIARQKKTPGAAAFVPSGANLPELREAVPHCQGCELYQHATQAVFGEGPANAKIMFIGEQPGDQEDRAGRPFVGPAGEVLNRALQEAGLNRADVYVTNAVKHFAFEERGKRRIHRTPRLSEVTACRPWMEAEIAQIGPEMIVCLGATAAKAVFGAQFRLTEQRGKFLPSKFSRDTLATYHPSAVLRGDTQEAKDQTYRLLVQDLKTVAQENAKAPAGSAVDEERQASRAAVGKDLLF